MSKHRSGNKDSSIRIRFYYLVGFWISVLAGCGSGDWGTATGTVTFGEAPLKEGIITFHPESGGATAYGQVRDGEFEISTGSKSGLAVGQYKVTVSASTIPKEGTGEQARLLTPKKYSQPGLTDLKATVGSGLNRLRFELIDKP